MLMDIVEGKWTIMNMNERIWKIWSSSKALKEFKLLFKIHFYYITKSVTNIIELLEGFSISIFYLIGLYLKSDTDLNRNRFSRIDFKYKPKHNRFLNPNRLNHPK